MSLKQVRCWSEAEYSGRDQLISTHRTPIRHTHTPSPALSLSFSLTEFGEKTIRFSLVTAGKQICLHTYIRIL
jgi:hypothetical protein